MTAKAENVVCLLLLQPDFQLTTNSIIGFGLHWRSQHSMYDSPRDCNTVFMKI